MQRHILLGEAATQQALACDHMVTSELIEIECRRVIQRCRMQCELDDEGLITGIDRLGQVLKGMNRCARALGFQTPLLS